MTVNLSMFAGAGAQIFDNSGNPLSGGLIYAYDAGTTTPRATYTTSAGNVAHTNPIVLDSAGRVPSGGEIWLTDNQDYKFVLKTSADVLIATYDNVAGNGSGILASLAASNGATLVGFTGFKSQVGTVADLADDDGSDWIGFEQSGTGAVARSAQDKMRDILSVKDFGAVGDGVANDTAAVIAAITAAVAATPATLVFPAGTYKVTDSLGSYFATDLVIDLQGSVIEATGIPNSTTVLAFNGVANSYVNLTANALQNTSSVSVGSTSGFAANNWVKIVSEGIWDSNNTSSRFGEICQVKDTGLTSTFIPLTTPLQSDYTTAQTAKVAKLTPVQNIVVRNGTIIGPSISEDGCNGVAFRIAVNVRCEGLNVSGFDNTQIFMRNTVNGVVTNCALESAKPTSTGYGVSFGDASQDCICSNSTFDRVRHSLSTNNSPASDYGITRRITFIGNTVRASEPAASGTGGDAIDTHGGADYISIIGNSVIGSSGIGINVECPNTVVTDNTIVNTYAYGIYVHNEADIYGSAVVANNSVTNAGAAGIYVSQGTRGTAFWYRSVSVDGNVVRSVGLNTPTFSQNAGVVVKVSDATVLNRAVSVTNNTVVETTKQGIFVSGCRNGVISGNSLNQHAESGIVLETGISVSISGNSINSLSSTTFPGISVSLLSGSSTVTRNAIAGNTIGLNSGSSAAAALLLSNDVTNTGAWNNVSQGFTGGFVLGSGAGNVAANNI